MADDNSYKVIISDYATKMLLSHTAFLSKVNKEAASRLVSEFQKTAQSLESMPNRCPWLIGEYIPKNMYHFILFEKRYMLIFQIKDNIVYVDYVIDTRQDYYWLIR